jgi:hypothetical protein
MRDSSSDSKNLFQPAVGQIKHNPLSAKHGTTSDVVHRCAQSGAYPPSAHYAIG